MFVVVRIAPIDNSLVVQVTRGISLCIDAIISLDLLDRDLGSISDVGVHVPEPKRKKGKKKE